MGDLSQRFTPQQRKGSAVIIGAGMTGILLAIKLREAGLKEITILEKADRVGGTWRENRYPGVACDIPAHMYAYSFAPKADWSNLFARGPEIQRYFESVAETYQVNELCRFNTSAEEARFKRGKWQVRTSQGDTLNADFLFCATGVLHHPAKPDIPGLDQFEGPCWHTAEWRDDVDIRGERIGFIGTGSTAAQAIPELVDAGARLTVFQRTPQWLLPLRDIRIGERAKRFLRRHPRWVTALRDLQTQFVAQFFTKATAGHRFQHALLTAICRLNLFFSIRNPELRRKLTPDYKVGCKRIVVNTTFYRGIQKANAHLETSGIDRVTEKGVFTRDGKFHRLDALVLATGFHPTQYMRPMKLHGRDDLTLEQAWQKKIRAYRSVTLPGFPNFFLMLGPHSPIGNFSVTKMSEVQTGYIMQLVKAWQRGEFDEVEPTNEAVDRFNAYVRDGLKNTAWVGGCQSWYLDADGDPILWPYTWAQWEKEMASPERTDFDFRFSPQTVSS